jgi:hypothetical protein
MMLFLIDIYNFNDKWLLASTKMPIHREIVREGERNIFDGFRHIYVVLTV